MENTAEQFLREKGHNLNAIVCKDDSLTQGYMDLPKLMEEYHQTKLKNIGVIGDVMDSVIWKPTMEIRWEETDRYSAYTDSFEKVLHQKFIGDKGHEEWREVDTIG